MAIRQKGTRWQVDVTVNGQRAPRVMCDTRTEALRTEADFRARLLAGVPAERLTARTEAAPKVGTIMELIAATTRARWAGTKGEGTAVRNASDWADELGAEYLVADLTPDAVQDVVDSWLANGLKPGTINRKLAALNVMLKVALDRNMIGRIFKMPWKREYEGRLRFFSDEEASSLISHAAYDPQLHRMFLVALETGMRLGEIERLTRRDIDGKAKRVLLGETKGDRRRSVPLTLAASAALDAQAAGKMDHERVFPEHLNSRHISRVITAWKRGRGLPEDDAACFHTFRHTTCSRLMQRGVPVNVVKDFMGHAVIETTMRYAHLAPDSLELARAALERG